MIAISALTETLIAICVDPSTSDCSSTLPCPGSMNCGINDRYMTAILGLSRLVAKPMVNSRRGLSAGRSRTWNGERPPGRSACQARYNRYSAPPMRSAS
ncbi:hypothetical protein D3C75_965090 [compost metagenome]